MDRRRCTLRSTMANIDVVICSLLTHHLTNPQIVQFLRWMEQTDVSWLVYQRSPSSGGALSSFSSLGAIHELASVRQKRWAGVDSPQLHRRGLAELCALLPDSKRRQSQSRVPPGASVCWQNQIEPPVPEELYPFQ